MASKSTNTNKPQNNKSDGHMLSYMRNTFLRGGGGTNLLPPRIITINTFNTSGTNPSPVTTLANTGDTFTYSTAGYYTLTVPPASSNATLDMWAWGAGGKSAGGPGPGGGAAGGGVRGRVTILPGQSLTFLVGGAGLSGGNPPVGFSTFPDGGYAVATSYPAGGGGGSSRIGANIIPFPTINSAPTQYLLIGGGGGGGSNYLDNGTYQGQGGYPSGYPGGSFYPSDGAIFGGGGTQSAGGAGGPAGRQPAGFPGSKYFGGISGNEGGGSGGGGYYGGGGAGGYYAHGGGGSGYIDPSLTNTASFDTTPGPSSSLTAVGDPSNPGIKTPTAGNCNNPGIVVFRIV